MNGYDKHGPFRVFEDQVGARLTPLLVPLPTEKAHELARGGHLVNGQSDCLGVNSAG